MTRRTIVIIVGGIVACSALAGVVVAFVVVPAIMNSGVGATLADVFTLRQAIMASGLVTDVNVRVGVNRDSRGSARTLSVDARWQGEPESREIAATRIARIVLDNYEDIQNIDIVSIGLLQGASVGPVSVTQNQRFAYSPAQWRERVARLAS